MRSKVLISIFLITLAISIVGLLLFTFEGGFGGRGRFADELAPRSLWLVLFVVPLVIAVSVLGYSVIFPEIGEKKPTEKVPSTSVVGSEGSALDAVLRVLNDDERKVIGVLVSEGGTMLQKDIRWKTGLSRVKTHRVLFRLAERGLVSAEKYYNTNKIVLAEWLLKGKKTA